MGKYLRKSPKAHKESRRPAFVRMNVERLEARFSPAVISSFQGLTASPGGPEPPDTILAVSQTNIVEAVNTSYQVFNKAGTPATDPITLQSFFSSVIHASDLLTDPYVIFDDLTNRFVMGILEYNFTTEVSYYDFAVSNDARGLGWSIYQVDVSEDVPPGGPYLSDFPKIGFNADAIVVTFNQFRYSSGSFNHIFVLSINAANLFAGTLTLYGSDRAAVGPDATLFPAQMHGSVAGNPMYFAETGNGGNSIVVVSATNLLSNSPTFNDGPNNTVTVGSFLEPLAVPGVTSTIDARIVSADWRAGKLVTAHTIKLSGDPNTHARWYQFSAPVSGLPSLIQESEVTDGVNSFYPSIALNVPGDIGMTYLEIGGSIRYMSMAVGDRLASDASGTMHTGILVQPGAAAYSGTRGGDYSGTVTDPVDGRTFWSANEYATSNASPNWGTAIGNFSPVWVGKGDFNGDKKTDLIYFLDSGQWYVSLSTGSSFAPQTLWGTWSATASWTFKLGDFNGDGKTDIAGWSAVNGQWYVGLSTGSSFTTTGPWATWSTSANWTFEIGDFNGDKKDDVAGWSAVNGQWYVGLSNGSSNFNTAQWATWSTSANWTLEVGDFNGDGKADIAGWSYANGQWWVGTSTGSSFNAPTMWNSWSNSAAWTLEVGDFNGDGKVDVAGWSAVNGQWWVGLSTGTSFGSPSIWATWSTSASWILEVGDFNGDGKTDIAGWSPVNGTWYVGLSTGTSFNTSLWTTWSTSANWMFEIGDFNGDGKTDIAGWSAVNGQWWVGLSTGTSFGSPSIWATWNL